MKSLGRWSSGVIASVAVLCGAQRSSVADTIVLTPSKDNTLIETIDGATSNGIGEAVFCGRVGNFGGGFKLRAVMAFDVSAIPAGSTINSVSLTLVLIQTVNGDQTHMLHRLLADWGEGTSDASGGSGAPSTPGDATWLHTFFPDQFWTNPGGDFVPVASASQTVPGVTGPVTWSDPLLAADVQSWLDAPATNFGWLMTGNEDEIFTSKKFASKDNFVEEDRPKLTIDFTPPPPPPPPCPGDITHDGIVNVADLLAVINAWGSCTGCAADANGDDVINVADLLMVINGWGPCP